MATYICHRRGVTTTHKVEADTVDKARGKLARWYGGGCRKTEIIAHRK